MASSEAGEGFRRDEQSFSFSAGKAGRSFYFNSIGSGRCKDIPDRWYPQISVSVDGWKCDRKCMDAISSWQFGLHLLSGGLQNGLRFLRFYIDAGWIGAKSDSSRDVRADLSDSGTDGRTRISYCNYGLRGTFR